MKVSTAIRTWFTQLPPRDQKILRFGLPVIAGILVLGLFATLVDARTAALQRWQKALTLEPRLSLLLSSAAPNQTLPANFSRSQSDKGVTTIQFSGVPFSQVVEQIAEWEKSGGRIQGLLVRRASDGLVSGEIRGSGP